MNKEAILARRAALVADLGKAHAARQQAEADAQANRDQVIAINGAIQDCDYWLGEEAKLGQSEPKLQLVENGA